MFSAFDEANEVVKSFRMAFETYKEKPILLYGMGVNTKILIQNLKDYKIVGVMDAKHEGENFEGMYVYSEEEAKTVANIIVIVARAAVLPIIYNRIKHLEKSGFAIYDIAGGNLNKMKKTYSGLQKCISEEALKRSISEHDVICFDVFDTLIARKVVRPEDIFEIVEKRLKSRGITIDFCNLRKRATDIAYRKKVSPNLDDIYYEMNCMADLGENIFNEIMREELQAEWDFITPRKKIVLLMKYAKQEGKKVYLVSDMYLNALQITRLLEKCGIREYDELFVSCEYAKTKWPQGDLFEEVKKKNSEGVSILHIGDSEGADVECAMKKGMDAARILNIYEVIVHSPFRTLLSFNRKLGDSIAIGAFACKYLSDPFSISDNGGVLYLEKQSDVGYICYGPLVIGFLVWIKRQCVDRGLSQVVYMARDGWILEKTWKIMEQFFPASGLPRGEYVLGSRRALAVPALRGDQDIMSTLQKVPSAMKNREMLSSRYGIECSDVSEEEEKAVCVCKRKKEILINAERERKAYNKYISEVIGDSKKVAVIDAVSAGTIGKYFFQTTQLEGCLLCMVISNVPNYSVCDEIESHAYMGADSKYAPKWQIHKHVGELESVLTAPGPMFVCFDENGAERYATLELSQKNVKILQEVQDGIIEYAREICAISPDFETMELTPELCDTFFGFLYETNSCLAEKVKTSLGVENNF